MRASRYEIFSYAAIIGVPLLIFLIFISTKSGTTNTTTTLSYLVLLGLGVFAIFGVKNVFLHKRYQQSGQPIMTGETEEGKAVNSRGIGTTEVNVKIKRFNNSTNKFDESNFVYNANSRSTVLEALLKIKSYGDSTLSVRCNCRMGICGSCGVVVNGKQKLACETNILTSSEDNTIEVSPMLGHPVLKDLVTDFDDFFNRHKSVSPTLERKDVAEKYKAKEEYKQSKEQVEKFLPYSYCIMCGLCLDACPVVNTNPNFVGPQALSQAYRYHADSRDQGGKKKLFDADTEDGAWGCEFSGSCSKACPKGVDPAGAIQLLKSDIMKNISDNE